MIGDYIDIDAHNSFIGGGIIEPEVCDGLIDLVVPMGEQVE